LLLWVVCGSSFGYIRFLQYGGELPRIPKLFRRRPQFRVLPKAKPRSSAPAVELRQGDSSELDQLLEKISKHGLASLTYQERAALERAREKLLENDQK
jgi:hypothetical protein